MKTFVRPLVGLAFSLVALMQISAAHAGIASLPGDKYGVLLDGDEAKAVYGILQKYLKPSDGETIKTDTFECTDGFDLSAGNCTLSLMPIVVVKGEEQEQLKPIYDAAYRLAAHATGTNLALGEMLQAESLECDGTSCTIRFSSGGARIGIGGSVGNIGGGFDGGAAHVGRGGIW